MQPTALPEAARLALAALGGSRWTDLLAAAVVAALATRFQVDWPLEQGETLRQRCMLVLTILAAGARLWVTRMGVARH